MLATLRRILLAASLSTVALASAAQAAVTVEFWHSFDGSSGKALEQIIGKFEAAHPDIKIDAQDIGDYNAIVAKLQAAIPAHRAPDAVIMEVTRYGLFADRGVLKDLTPYLDADPLKGQLFDYAREAGIYKGKNYIIPFNSSTPVLYLNTKLLKEAGIDTVPELKTWDEILKVAQTVTDKLGSQGITGIAAPGQFARWGLVEDNDSELIDPRTNDILLDAPGTIAAYQWMADLVHKYHVASPDGVTNEAQGEAEFTAGKVAMMLNSVGDYGGVRQAVGPDLTVVPMPCNKVCRVPIGGAGIGIVAASDKAKQDAAWTFISYMASADANATWFAATGYMPINKNTAAVPVAADALKTQPALQVSIDQLPFAVGRPRPVVVTWMRAKEYTMWQAMALGQRDVTEAMKDFATQTRAEAAKSN
ncbi:MAG TPA: ABC transporter substrate-binding protein [Devosiaceae bacterium]|nr:ABC transporter substrate-binding protein [Devosiaceae bacterium]